MSDTDFMEMFKKVKDMSDLFGMDNKSTNSFNMDSMLKAAEMVKKIQNLVGNNSEDESENFSDNNNSNVFISEYFENSSTNMGIETIKTALPYIDPKYRKGIGVFVKMIEIQKLMETYSVTMQNIKTSESPAVWQKGLIQTLKPHIGDENKEAINSVIKLLDLKILMESFQKQKTEYIDDNYYQNSTNLDYIVLNNNIGESDFIL